MTQNKYYLYESNGDFEIGLLNKNTPDYAKANVGQTENGSVNQYCKHYDTLVSVCKDMTATWGQSEPYQIRYGRGVTAADKQSMDNLMAFQGCSITELPQDKSSITFDRMKDRHGRHKFAGTWYKEDGTTEEVVVAANHGDYAFTDDDIRSLLNDETVTIKNFRSKSGEISDITGKLKPKQYMGKNYVGFERVDVQKSHQLPASMKNIVSEANYDNQLGE